MNSAILLLFKLQEALARGFMSEHFQNDAKIFATLSLRRQNTLWVLRMVLKHSIYYFKNTILKTFVMALEQLRYFRDYLTFFNIAPIYL